MATTYRVTAPMVVVYDSVTQHYVNRGGVVPEFVTKEHLKQLLDAGLVEADGKRPDPVDVPSDPAQMTVKQLKAYAQEQGIELDGAAVKDEILAKVQAARSDQQPPAAPAGDNPAGSHDPQE